MARLVVMLVALAGCRQVFGLDEPSRVPADAAIDAAVACTSDRECPSAAPRCALAQGICVDCLSGTDCGDANAPLCDPSTHTCRGCLVHADCSSQACLPDGTCGDDDTVTYVAPTGSETGTCTFAAPCATVMRAHSFVTGTRKYVKLSGTVTELQRISFQLADVVWLADADATLTADGDPMVDVQGGMLAIYDLELVCIGTGRALRVSSDGSLQLRGVYIHGCGKRAVEVNGGPLVVDRSVIAENAGGIETGSGAFSITNTFFVRNGNEGAVKIEAPAPASNRFEFNTVVDNMANTGSTAGRTGGVECPNSNLMAVRFNIIARNTGYYTNTRGGCDFSQSIVTDDITPLAFVSPTTAPFDYHLTAPSVAVDAAAASTVAIDVDGDPRPYGGESDIGADEYTLP